MPGSRVALFNEKPTPSGQQLRSERPLIARSAAMCEILGLVRKIARANVPVLIQGEIGTGKQTIAREIHRQSPRAARPLVHVVCGSLRESDLEEKLFGPSSSGARTKSQRAGTLAGTESGQYAIPGRCHAATAMGPGEVAGRFAGQQWPPQRGRGDDRRGTPRDRLQHVRPSDGGRREPLLSRALLLSECRSHGRSHRCVAGRKMSGRWPSTFWPRHPRRPRTTFARGSPRKRGSCCCSTTGRVTSCNWPR